MFLTIIKSNRREIMSYSIIGGVWYVKYNGRVIARGKNRVVAYTRARKALGWD
jgi:hypothetical protein